MQLSEPHNLTRPIVMDATVEQHRRLPLRVCSALWASTRSSLRIPITATGPTMTPAAYRQRIAAICRWQRLEGRTRVLREENGVLPVVMGGNLDDYWASGSGRTAKAGARGAFLPSDHQLLAAGSCAALRCLSSRSCPIFDGDKLNMLLHGNGLENVVAEWQILSHAQPHAVPRVFAKCSDRYKIFERFYRLKSRIARTLLCRARPVTAATRPGF